ncbi:MAG: TetR family transcriptional regulator [Solirubrobacterales bacterium]
MRRRLDPEERRKEILRAAARAFAALPYDEVHVEAVAAAAGASRALVNHYFGDKRGLYLAVAQEMVERMPGVVRRDVAGGPEEMVAANTAAWLDIVESSPQAFLNFVSGGPVADRRLDEFHDDLRDRIARRMLANHLGTDEIPAPALTVMRAELSLIEQAVRDWVVGRGGDRRQTEALIRASILATVRQVIPAVLDVASGERSPS